MFSLRSLKRMRFPRRPDDSPSESTDSAVPFGSAASANTPCASLQPLLSAWLDDELSPGEVRRVEAHLKGCSGCRTELEALRVCCDSLRSGPEVEMPPELHLAIRSALAAEIAQAEAGDPCVSVRPLLSALIDAELEGAARDRVTAHLDLCKGCTAHLNSLRKTARLLASLPSVDPPHGLRAYVLARTTRRSWRPGPVPLGAAGLLAAAGILMLLPLDWLPQPGFVSKSGINPLSVVQRIGRQQAIRQQTKLSGAPAVQVRPDKSEHLQSRQVAANPFNDQPGAVLASPGAIPGFSAVNPVTAIALGPAIDLEPRTSSGSSTAASSPRSASSVRKSAVSPRLSPPAAVRPVVVIRTGPPTVGRTAAGIITPSRPGNRVRIASSSHAGPLSGEGSTARIIHPRLGSRVRDPGPRAAVAPAAPGPSGLFSSVSPSFAAEAPAYHPEPPSGTAPITQNTGVLSADGAGTVTPGGDGSIPTPAPVGPRITAVAMVPGSGAERVTELRAFTASDPAQSMSRNFQQEWQQRQEDRTNKATQSILHLVRALAERPDKGAGRSNNGEVVFRIAGHSGLKW